MKFLYAITICVIQSILLLNVIQFLSNLMYSYSIVHVISTFVCDIVQCCEQSVKVWIQHYKDLQYYYCYYYHY